MDKIEATCLVLGLFLICLVVFVITDHETKTSWCEDKGGVYIEATCVDKSVVIELEKGE